MNPRILIATLLLSFLPPVYAQSWKLENSIERALEVAPAMKMSQAEIMARKDELGLAHAWPNPSIDVRVDNTLGTASGDGGYDLTDVTISQPIPYKRLGKQQAYAQSRLDAASLGVGINQLTIERDVALVFHELQLADARYTLAMQKLAAAEQYLSRSENKKGKIIRYQSPLEKMRLKIILEQAHTSITRAEGRYNEVKSKLAQLLRMNRDDITSVSPLEKIKANRSLVELLAIQENHPELVHQSQSLMTSQSLVQLERSRMRDDPSISLSRGKDTFSSGEKDVYAVMFNIQIPLWSQKTPAVSEAEYQNSQARIELGRMQQQLKAELQQSHMHLSHLLEQIEHHEKNVLVPAKQMYALTRKGFISGEFNVLTLIDASSTYYEAQQSYYQLLHDANAELAHLRYAAGIFVLKHPAATTTAFQGGQ